MLGLSVLTLVKNRKGHLLRQIEGLRRSIMRPDELIVVNMGQDRLQLPNVEFPVKMLELPSPGLPLAQARNLAASHARFEKLVFLDVDCIPMGRLLTEIARCMDGFEGLICAEIRYLAAGDLSDDWQENELLLKAAKHLDRSFPDNGLRQEQNYALFWSLAFAVRRSQFVYVGGFDERFTGYGAEDTEFALRAQDAGIDLAFLGGIGAFHQYHEIFDPPLQHFDDIVRNAQLFHDIRGTWPMSGWLDAFEKMNLILTTPEKIKIIRQPFEHEMNAARTTPLDA